MSIRHLSVLAFILWTTAAIGQDLYPKFYEAGNRINFVPEKNVYIITETQLDSCLKVNALYLNCEKRVDLLQMKTSQQDSVIKLLRLKELNFDSTLAHTSQKLSQCTDESQKCQKDLAKQKFYKKLLLGISGAEAALLILLLVFS